MLFTAENIAFKLSFVFTIHIYRDAKNIFRDLGMLTVNYRSELNPSGSNPVI